MEYCSLVEGELVREGVARPVLNPATETIVGEAIVPASRYIDRAVRAASDAYKVWRNEQWTVKSRLLLAIAEAIQSHRDELARLLTLEQGKPLHEARDEVALSIEHFEKVSKMRLKPNKLNGSGRSQVEQFFVPLGVIVGIIPWNFPLFTAVMKIAPALLVGNAIIVKPAPTTPLTTLKLGELLKNVVPAGLLQTLADDGTVGPRLVRHPGVAKVSFTGSTASGKLVMRTASPSLKRLALELGGNDPAVVFGDVDVNEVAKSIFSVAFLNCGQVCTAIKRLYVDRSIYERVGKKLAELADAAVVGDGLEQGVTIGPVQNSAQFEKVQRYLQLAREEGKVLAGGETLRGKGYFIRPTIVSDIDDNAPLVTEEQFGPILPVLAFDDEEEVVRRANATNYGLTASVWSKDLARAQRVARGLDAGTVWINKHLDLDANFPMTPCKDSGVGAIFGVDGLREFAQARLLNQ
jgi:acyl-CoA reductase-like NAD-dependent aldehyde dehydrogenase